MKQIEVSDEIYAKVFLMRETKNATFEFIMENMIEVYIENLENSVKGAIIEDMDENEKQYYDRANAILDRLSYLEEP